jgi:hypothetical protein
MVLKRDDHLYSWHFSENGIHPAIPRLEKNITVQYVFGFYAGMDFDIVVGKPFLQS